MSRIDEIRRRHKERHRRLAGRAGTRPAVPAAAVREPDVPRRPLDFAQKWLIKCLLSGMIVLAVALFEKSYADVYPSVQTAMRYALEEDLNFAKVSDWYERAFGEPLTIFPFNEKDGGDVKNAASQFAVPVNGTVTKGFSDATKGVYVETVKNAEVEAIDSGFVVSVENKEGIGRTVVIRHSNGAESWYGKLSQADVKVYEFVKKGQKLGKVTNESGKSNGLFYFALKEKDRFVDPIQVISFD
ncbi:M23 family metallopeptidase [Caenibacillus caldisaponilyticus]|uniref:M23 family metallopeptidase n=1 Tax=Caenibacillus caldisaponilyticus TaxID=1674942 RepID=UPI0009886AB7|nr:M23 family metallopeptidase [Caenibacillus caldisaponilyticus]